MQVVSRLRQLRSLSVDCPRLTPVMVHHLAKATSLEGLYIFGKKSAADMQRLQDALPRCKVIDCDNY